MIDFKYLLKRAVVYAAVAAFCLFSAFPFLIMLINSFKQDADLYRPQNNPFIYNFPATLNNWDLLFNRTNFPVFLKNSFIPRSGDVGT